MSLLPEINQASAEINKLVAQANIHQTIAPVNPAAFTDPADTLLLASRDPVIREVSVGMTGEAYSDYSVSGTPPLSLPNSLGKPLKAWSVELSPYQEGTGDPAPDNVRPIHGTDKLNMFVEESYDQSATPKAVLTLPQTVYTGTIGSEGGESRTRYRLYNGDASEQWTYSASWSKTNTAVFYSNVALTDALFTDFYGTYITNCNLLPPKSRQLLYVYDTQGIAYSGSPDPDSHYLTVRIPKTIAATAEEFTAFLASNPLEVVYMLINPAQFPLATPTIPTPTGTATTWATAEDGTVDSMKVTYYKSE